MGAKVVVGDIWPQRLILHQKEFFYKVLLRSWCECRGAQEGENWIKFVKVGLGHNLENL